ncbi:helix-turn-helix domain-containing protein [Candidatus Enterovibrio escicola]|uniref:helix-turn-helix domain-containing protein n=1 Tax=Candidatus Enterovibrio escicola TaxID=1927127 RepID=UPI001CC24532|nr:helix-turn-helix domain-containing protein [Candidatus Enterovibrio escacola]
MSIKVSNPTRKFVLFKLADNAGGKCWPSYEHIADMYEIDRHTAMPHTKKLKEDGLISVTYHKGKKGNSSNIY